VSESTHFDTGHIGLNVSNLERSKQFYQEVFAFQVQGESTAPGRRFAFLGDGERLLLTLWEQSEGRFAKASPGLHHLSFRVGNIDEVRRAERRLRQRGATLLDDGLVPHAEGMDSGGIFFEDPDGLRLEIFSPSGAGDATAPTAGAPSCGFF
jgi:lactoylglutathione lyase